MINFVVSLGRPVSVTLDEFKNFTNKLELNLDLAVKNNFILLKFSVILMYNQTNGTNKIKSIERNVMKHFLNFDYIK